MEVEVDKGDTAVSLFDGWREVRAAGGGDVILEPPRILDAGNIRKRGAGQVGQFAVRTDGECRQGAVSRGCFLPAHFCSWGWGADLWRLSEGVLVILLNCFVSGF